MPRTSSDNLVLLIQHRMKRAGSDEAEKLHCWDVHSQLIEINKLRQQLLTERIANGITRADK